MPFGVVNSPSTYQTLTDQVLRIVMLIMWKRARKYLLGAQETIFLYLDDWIIISNILEEHIAYLQAVFEVFRTAGLKMNEEKSQVGRSKVEFLGFIIIEEGMSPDPVCLEPITEYP